MVQGFIVIRYPPSLLKWQSSLPAQTRAGYGQTRSFGEPGLALKTRPYIFDAIALPDEPFYYLFERYLLELNHGLSANETLCKEPGKWKALQT